MQSVEVPVFFFFGVFANLSAMWIGTYLAGTVHNTVDSGTYPREIGPPHFVKSDPPTALIHVKSAPLFS